MNAIEYIWSFLKTIFAGFLFSVTLCLLVLCTAHLFGVIIPNIFHFNIQQTGDASSILGYAIKDTILPGWGRITAILGTTKFSVLGWGLLDFVLLSLIVQAIYGLVRWILFIVTGRKSLSITMTLLLLAGFINLIRFIFVDERMQSLHGDLVGLVIIILVLVIFIGMIGFVCAIWTK
jgi:hypothetical protein